MRKALYAFAAAVFVSGSGLAFADTLPSVAAFSFLMVMSLIGFSIAALKI